MSRKRYGNGRGGLGKDKLSAKDKVLTKMTKDGLVEQNVTAGEQKRVSKRRASFNLRDTVADDPAIELVTGLPTDRHVEQATPSKRQIIQASDAPLQTQSDSAALSQVGTSTQGEKLSEGGSHPKSHKTNPANEIVQTSTAQFQTAQQSRPLDSLPTQHQAKIYRFPTPNEPDNPTPDNQGADVTRSHSLHLSDSDGHRPRPKLTHRNKPQTALGIHKASTLRQSSRTAKLSLVPASSEATTEPTLPTVDINSTQQPVTKKQKHHNQQRRQPKNDVTDVQTPADELPNPSPPSKLQFSVDERTDTPVIQPNKAYNQISSDTTTVEPSPNQPRSPTDNTPSHRNKHNQRQQNAHRSHQRRDNTGDNSTRNNQHDTATQATISTKTSKLEYKVNKTTGKLDKSKGNLPSNPKIRIERTFDEAVNKGKTRLRLDREVKSQREHLKGPVPLRPLKFATNTAITKAHVKIYQVEHENVGTQAAHKVELAGETVIRSALRHRKMAPYKHVARLEHKLSNQSAKLSYRKALDSNPRLKRNPVARVWQKRQIKRRHMRALREAQKNLAKSQKTGSFVTRTTRTLTMLVRRNPKIIIALAIIFVVINILSSLIGALAGLSSSGMGAVFATTYLSDETEIEAVSLAYNRWEMDLNQAILNVETSHPGFDEYRFNTGQIIHNPFELMAYLTAVHLVFTMDEVESHLRGLFDEQYQLSFTPSIEVRYRDSGEVDADGNPIYVPFEWHVLTTTLVARSFTDVVLNRMTTDQRLHFDLLMQSRGQRQIVGSPFDFSWHHLITSEYGYRIHPITGTVELHRGIDIGLPTGTPILSGLDGTVTFAGVMGGFGNVVIIHGNQGLETRHAHMDTMSVSAGQSVGLGDTIGTVGSTGQSTGPHLHMEVLRYGQFLNPIFFVDMGTGINPAYGIPREALDDETFASLWAVIQQALGRPYIWGASGPNAFDCSGFVFHAFNQSGVVNIPRTTAQGYYNMSTRISRSDLRPGDLVFFQGTFSTYRIVTHIGIYLGNGMMAHAGSTVEIVSFETPFWTRHFYGFGRLNQ